MARGDEAVRQLKVLRKLEGRRTNTIPKLAADLGVTERTIRRDLDALQLAGFPIYDERADGAVFWRIDGTPSRTLERHALTFSELCALYASRALIESAAGSEFLADLQRAFDKLGAAFTPKMKKLVDEMPQMIRAKAVGAKRGGHDVYTTTSRLLESVLQRQVVAMRYHSHASDRVKEYVVHPYRIVYAQGGLYLMAFVPAYKELRTFAIERVKRLSPQKETFSPLPAFESDPFSDSMGVHHGPTVKVQLRFGRKVAESVREHRWHPSQQFKDRADGSVVMTLQVSDDYALRTWILGFGHAVRVLAPPSLVEWAVEEYDAARQQYAGGRTTTADLDAQPALPFLFSQIARA